MVSIYADICYCTIGEIYVNTRHTIGRKITFCTAMLVFVRSLVARVCACTTAERRSYPRFPSPHVIACSPR